MADTIEFGTKLFPVEILGFNDNESEFMVVDASISEGHEVRAEITSHPVEFGANISDHVISQPRTFTLKGRVASVDLKNRGGILDGATYRGHVAWNALSSATRAATNLTVYSQLETYENVFIINLRAVQDVTNALALDFEATFQEVVISTTTLTNNDADNILNGTTSEQYSSTVSRGSVSAEEYEG